MTGTRQSAAVLAGFGRALRAAGLVVSSEQLRAGGLALAAVDPESRQQVYWALRCALLISASQADRFDPVFSAFWDGSGLINTDPVRLDVPAPELALATQEAAELDQGETDADGTETRGTSFSAFERLRRMDLAMLEEPELQRADRIARRAGRLAVPLRRSRRPVVAASGPRLAYQATLRQAMRTEAHPLELAWRRPGRVIRRLVFLIDVSGSMEAYARPFLSFAAGARQSSKRVEAFAFGTRLTHLTGALKSGDGAGALAAVSRAVPDWAGGTRIGESLAAYNREWGRRGMSRSAAVVIVSDGWERGDTGLLSDAMAELSRQAHTVVWANPLAGDSGYEPLAAGMAVALKSVDLFVSGQTLSDLNHLASLLSGLSPGRGFRVGNGSRRGSHEPRYDVVLRRYSEESL